MQFGELHGFEEEAVHAGGEAAVLLFGKGGGSEGDDGQRRGLPEVGGGIGGPAADAAGGFPAVEVGRKETTIPAGEFGFPSPIPDCHVADEVVFWPFPKSKDSGTGESLSLPRFGGQKHPAVE